MLKVREHAGMLWLWAAPGLLEWKFQICWLFSPVNTGVKRSGDLWGVDSMGDLLIMENKLAGGRDPFQNFIVFVEDGVEPRITPRELEEKWRELFDEEKKSAPLWRKDPRGTYLGILPYSRRRAELRRWPDVSEKVERLVHGEGYKQDVHRYLKRRERRGSPPPVYFAFYTCSSSKTLKATPRAIRSQSRLVKGKNPQHALFAAACAKKVSNNKVRIERVEVATQELRKKRKAVHPS
ncbi:MAG: hypothetical protein JRJ66_05090 [Deltaproteobacteria bacterium]|nr:hypothetical protein [Deltaproteobacteria bacterium]MBW2299522.1 hypothetical protein [Deltaproteobacteria bacterium]